MEDIVLVKPDQRGENTAQTPGMIRQAAVAPALCGSKGLWIGFVSSPPGAGGAHHHGSAESGIYVIKGKLKFHFGERLEKSLIAEAGDFLYVPPETVHVEENLSEAESAELIVARNSTEFLVVNVPDPRESA
jgi:uncharacterized RmlC-like cupin family protein